MTVTDNIMWEKSAECSLQSIVDRFEAIDNNKDKKNFLINVLDDCAVCPTPTPVKTKEHKTTKNDKPKRKRPLTGWNCYLKWCAKKTERSFPECLTDEKLKSTVYHIHKPKWNELAKQDCPLEGITFPKQTKITEY